MQHTALLLSVWPIGCIALAYYKQFFPTAQTLMLKHLHKAGEFPIIIHQAATYAPLVSLFRGLVPYYS